jgi:hypothetical protein
MHHCLITPSRGVLSRRYPLVTDTRTLVEWLRSSTLVAFGVMVNEGWPSGNAPSVAASSRPRQARQHGSLREAAAGAVGTPHCWRHADLPHTGLQSGFAILAYVPGSGTKTLSMNGFWVSGWYQEAGVKHRRSPRPLRPRYGRQTTQHFFLARRALGAELFQSLASGVRV